MLEQLLIESNYDRGKTNFIVQGFKEGFSLGYSGPHDRRDELNNIPLHIGTKSEVWAKLMKEVKLGRYAGPFDCPQFQNYIQSPIGLVPKDGGRQTRLIFDLSYDFGDQEYQKSFNHFTPDQLCTVKYNDLDHAIANSLKMVETRMAPKGIFYSKTDLKSAFHLLPGKPSDYGLLTMCAYHLVTGKKAYFHDKCLAFGASI